MRRKLKTTAIALAILGTGSVGSAFAGEPEQEAYTACKPASAIRHRLAEKPESKSVRKAPAHGSCRNTQSPQLDEDRIVTGAAVSFDANEGHWICRPNSAIRVWVAGKPRGATFRLAPKHGSCRNP